MKVVSRHLNSLSFPRVCCSEEAGEVRVAGPKTPGLVLIHVPRELGSLGWAGQNTFEIGDDTLLDGGEHGGRVWRLSRPGGMGMRGSNLRFGVWSWLGLCILTLSFLSCKMSDRTHF